MDVDNDDIVGYAVEAGIIEPTAFSTALFKQTYEQLEKIDNVIEKYAIGWKKAAPFQGHAFGFAFGDL